MQTLDHLCNVIGPRLTGTPQLVRANEWARDQLSEWGLSDARLESWGPFGRGWTIERFSMQVIDPYHVSIVAAPKAWSSGFDAAIEADVIHLDAEDESGLEAYRGKLKGRIVLIGETRSAGPRFEPLGSRRTDESLLELATANPAATGQPDSQRAESAAERRARFRESGAVGEALTRRRATSNPSSAPAVEPTSGPTTDSTTAPTTQNQRDTFASKALGFVVDEGAAMVLTPSSKGDGGTLFVSSAAIPGDPPRRWNDAPTTRPRIWAADGPSVIPQAMLVIEDYNRLVNMLRNGLSPKIAVDLKVKFHADGVNAFNTIAEIPGTDLKDEIVMLGAHIDSWHSGAGTTDNGVGTAVMMEAVRILKTLNLQPRRTIRIALWSGEEQGLLGSKAYVRDHFGYRSDDLASAGSATQPATQPETAPTTQPSSLAATGPATLPSDIIRLPGHEKLSVYFNLDNGAGRIRGIFTQGNTAAKPIFERWLLPFHDLDARTVTLSNTGGTDHLSFDRIGLPGFQFIQDPLEYSSRTHHSNYDVYERVPPEDAKQAATIIAAFVWNAANMDDRFPRKPDAK